MIDRSIFSENVFTTRGATSAVLALVLVEAILFLALSSGSADAATTFTVNRAGDSVDRKLSDSACDTSSASGRQCTLRAAIQEANDTPGADTINFRIMSSAAVKTISPTRPLPAISKAVTINGYSQPGARANTLAVGSNAVLKVVLNGATAGRQAHGITIAAANSTVKGLVVNRFERTQVAIGGAGATGNKVLGNYLGTNAAGTAGAGAISTEAPYGVAIGSAGNFVGGATPGARNVISGNAGYGVLITGDRNLVRGNYIGTDKTGNADLGNANLSSVYSGVRITGDSNVLGGTFVGARNVISGNGGDGVSIDGFIDRDCDCRASSNSVLGNYVGTDASGTADLGNTGSGVSLTSARLNTIGEVADGAGNVISGNGGHGVSIGDADADRNEVEGNLIGTDKTGTADLGNDRSGVAVFGGLSKVGGTDNGAGNVIAFNGHAGVSVGTAGTSILSNSTFSNGGLGIDLGNDGVTANDPGDTDGRQNFPEIASAVRDTATDLTTLTGTLNSAPNQIYTIQCFIAEAGGDPSGNGEGKTLLSTLTTTTGGDGNGGFACVSPMPQAGQAVTATATNETSRGTSEFSQNVAVVTVGP